MGLLGGLFGGGGDPAAKWVRDPALKLDVDLETASLAGVRLGSRATSLAPLGAPTNATPAKDGVYTWEPLGLEAFVTKGLIDAYAFSFDGPAPFPGAFLRGGTPIPLGGTSTQEELIRLLGEPWHRYADPDFPDAPLQLFYETRALEWKMEILPSGTLGSLTLSAPPTLANPETRKLCRVEKRWPPA